MSAEQEIDLGQIPPSILVSMKSNPCSWSTVIGELVDNSLDAGATRVDIEEMEREERSKLFADFSGFVEALSSVLTAQQASEQLQPVSEGAAR